MVNHSGRKDDSKAEGWAETMRAWSESGLTQAAFCKQRGIPISTFQYWRYQRRAGQGADVPGNAASGRKAAGTKKAAPPSFAPVRIIPASSPESAGIAVVLTNGRRLEVPPDVDIDWLARAAAALETPRC